MEIYYLRYDYLDMMIDTDKITLDNIYKTHVKMPSPTFESKSPEEVFIIYNSEIKNPLTTIENQNFIRYNKTHTSMSVGDIVEIDNKFYLCENLGWRELKIIGEKICRI